MSIANDWFNTRAWAVDAERPIFQGWNEAQKRTLIFVPNAIVPVAGTASRVKMNAKVRCPGPRPDHQRESLRANLKNALDRGRHCHT